MEKRGIFHYVSITSFVFLYMCAQWPPRFEEAIVLMACLLVVAQ